MKKSLKNVPLFPLQAFLLPGGAVRLKVYKQKYLKLVSTASQGEGFVICNEVTSYIAPLVKVNKTKNTNKRRNSQWGSLVEITNFHLGDDGLLEIDVCCQSLVNIIDATRIKDKSHDLHYVDVEPFEHWSQNYQANQTFTEEVLLAESLEEVLSMNQTLIELYPTIQSNNPHWVVARWLELLPLQNNVKSKFVASLPFTDAQEFVASIISK